MSFEKVTKIQGTELVDYNGSKILHVSTEHALIQSIGYIKFTAEPYERIYLRGQCNLYDTLSPSLYRSVNKNSGISNKNKILKEYIKKINKELHIFSTFDSYAHEPLLQHYGISTSWLDVVDNAWIALWFSLHRAFSAGRRAEFLHFERLNPQQNQFGYIILLAANEERRLSPKKGVIRGSDTELIDLRIAAPSVFLRPHAQHGLLFRVRSQDGSRIIDYSSAIRGIIRFDLSEANRWIGDGGMISTRSLFPPPFYDSGYRLLLSTQAPDKSIGTISHVGT